MSTSKKKKKRVEMCGGRNVFKNHFFSESIHKYLRHIRVELYTETAQIQFRIQYLKCDVFIIILISKLY